MTPGYNTANEQTTWFIEITQHVKPYLKRRTFHSTIANYP